MIIHIHRFDLREKKLSNKEEKKILNNNKPLGELDGSTSDAYKRGSI
jgi:hypothetical protein